MTISAKTVAVKTMPALLVTLLGACSAEKPVPPLDLSARPEIAATFITERVHAGEEHDAEHQAGAHQDHDDTASNTWQFWRGEDRLEINVPAHQTGELWLRDGKTVFYQKLFHADAKTIEYQLADLEGLNVQVKWDTNALMVAPEILEKLEVEDEKWIDDQPVLNLQGRVDGITYDIDWLVSLNLPYRMVKTDVHGASETTSLQQVAPLMQNDTSRPNSSNYEIIDYADLGDRERDPFVLRIQNQLPGGHQHSH